jgi:hypothetical protein
MELGSEDRNLAHLEAPSTPKTQTDADIAPIIQHVGAPSIAQIERLIGELQEAKSFLVSEGERIQREMVRYIKFTQMASASVKIIFDSLSGWRQAGHPMRKFVSSADDTTGRMARSVDSTPEV